MDLFVSLTMHPGLARAAMVWTLSMKGAADPSYEGHTNVVLIRGGAAAVSWQLDYVICNGITIKFTPGRHGPAVLSPLAAAASVKGNQDGAAAP